MDARLLARAMTREPRLLGGEAQKRREPAHEAIEHAIEHGARGAAARAVGRVAIERILAHVEIEGGEIDRAEIMERGEERVEIIFGRTAPHHRVELGQAMEDEALELRHLGVADPLVRREAGEIAEEIAQGVAQAAIDFGLVFQDIGTDAQILGVIGRHDPEPQDVGAADAAPRPAATTALPEDFDILRPSSSSTKPCVSTAS